MSLEAERNRLIEKEGELRVEKQRLDAALDALPDKNKVPDWLLLALKALTADKEALKADKEALKAREEAELERSRAAAAEAEAAARSGGVASSSVAEEIEIMKARTKDVEQQLQRLRFSITDANAAGNNVVTLLAPQCDIAAVVAKLQESIPDMRIVVEAVQELEVLFTRASTASDELPVQQLFTAVADALCKNGGTQLYACDTSTSGYPTNPIHKIDLIISSCPKPTKGQVLWSTVLAVGELKPTLSSTTLYHEAIGQVSDRVQTLFTQQPGRMWCFGFVGGRQEMELLLFQRRCGDASHLFSVKRTGLQPFHLGASSPGLQLLAALLCASPSSLGFNVPILEPRFEVSVAGGNWRVQLNNVLQPDISNTGSVVYSCTCESTPSDASSKETFQAVLKSGPYVEHEARIIQEINDAGMTSGVPILWHKGHLPSGTPCFIIKPFGTPLNYASTPKELLTVIRDVAATVAALSSVHQIMQLDVSPNNIVMGADGQGILIDFHIATKLPALVASPLSGTLKFLSLTRLNAQPPNVSGELESLLYTLIYWACDGRLHWGHAVGAASSAALKYHAMHLMFEEKVVERCTMPRLVPALKALRDLFFVPVYRTDIQPQDFIRMCDEHMPL